MSEPLVFLYRNHRNEVATRRVQPHRVYRGADEYHPEMQWLMTAFDLDRDAVRTFALRDVLAWGEEAVRRLAEAEAQRDALLAACELMIRKGMTPGQYSEACDALVLAVKKVRGDA